MMGTPLDISPPETPEPEQEKPPCKHRWRTVGSLGGRVIVRECDLCGEEDEKDVS